MTDNLVEKEMLNLARQAKESAKILAQVSSANKTSAIDAMAEKLIKDTENILYENEKDIKSAKDKSSSQAFIDRLKLTPQRVQAMAKSLKEIGQLSDPVGEIITMWTRPNGLQIGKMCVPIGVIAIIYESRPNVTSDCAGLCLKAGNSVILRGGSEAINSNKAIHKSITSALKEFGLPEKSVCLIQTIDRAATRALLKLEGYIDLVIPRGGEGLIREVVNESRIPVIKHYKGICHVYVDRDADLKMAEEIAYNAKVERPGVCNAMETLLVHKAVAEKFLPDLFERYKKAGVEIRGCPETIRICPWVKSATEEDWATEYLALILSVKVVENMEEAIEHISRYGSQHTDSIVTENYHSAWKFLRAIDSACVFVNASTRFSDGGEFGLGAEVGISTGKLHARGPMGVRDLTTYKYIVLGSGQVRKSE